jgi:hypothetical protein
MDYLEDLKKREYYYWDVSFNKLMRRRVSKILLICSTYDAFMLEEDGRIDEQIFNEYVSLNLRYPPHFIQVSTSKEAFEILENEEIDLVINMLSVTDMDPFELSDVIKSEHTSVPIVILAPHSREITKSLEAHDLSSVDYVFSWLGHSEILLAIVKLIEDRINVEFDVNEVGVQTIILVEDNVRFYSSYLPTIYKIIFTQSKSFMAEGLNEHQKMMRMRGRPKILLANTYEEAMQLYQDYKANVLGIISDISYEREGEEDHFAGLRLCEKVREDDRFLPFLLQSSQLDNKNYADRMKAGFIHKHSKTLLLELREYIRDNFAFGDFIFRNGRTGEEVDRAKDLQELQVKILNIEEEVLKYHINRNHFSKWLNARALFHIANVFRYLRPEHFSNLEEVRQFMYTALAGYRRNTGRGIIAKFYRDRFDEYVLFARIGEGSIGGKARGLAFIDTLLKEKSLHYKYKDVYITIPRTVVLSTEVFDEFMQKNNLYEVAMSNRSDKEILEHFVKARLPKTTIKDLGRFLEVVKRPLAVRSSSMLEDSHYQPFAGVYSTFMVPNASDAKSNLRSVANAIKGVYASVYFEESKAYMAATQNVIDEEKMAIVLQEVCGKSFGDYYMPTFSGVSRSLNFYPLEHENSVDGVAEVAVGLGKYIVDGNGSNLRFSPKSPDKILQLSTPEMALQNTQRYYYGLNLNNDNFRPDVDDASNLLKTNLRSLPQSKDFRPVLSTFDYSSNILRPGVHDGGKKLVTFSHILKYNKFPLADILNDVLSIGAEAMNNPVEIEFAVNMNVINNQQHIFNLLQIRPIVEITGNQMVDLGEIDEQSTILTSYSALGNGFIQDIYDFVYVKPETFDKARTPEIANLIGEVNKKFVEEDLNYVLVGPGRWGSSDQWLGIPVNWTQISQARVIVESGLDNFRIDPSQGTHFFQNLTSFQVGYFTINPFVNDGFYDLDFLNSQNAVFENEFLRHVRFEKPIKVAIDGKQKKGVVYKPE